mgnify:CR=1 FL=1
MISLREFSKFPICSDLTVILVAIHNLFSVVWENATLVKNMTRTNKSSALVFCMVKFNWLVISKHFIEFISSLMALKQKLFCKLNIIFSLFNGKVSETDKQIIYLKIP